MLAAFAELKAEGIEAVVFGDIYLEDLRAYREQLLAHAGLTGRYPLWGRDPGELYAEFVALGWEAVTVCVDTTRLGERHLGRRLDAAFRDTLPAGVDPCGERGEYHSFAFNGPAFRRPVRFALGDVHLHAPFAFQELHPVGAKEGSVRKHVHEEVFPASTERLFALLHTPSAIRGWWGVARAIVLPQPGGVWAATWGEAEDDADYITAATIRDFEPPRRMVLTDYRYRARDGPLPFAADFVTEFLVLPHSEGTVLRVTQNGFPAGPEADEFYTACGKGWRDTFAGVRRYLSEQG
jgi:uncharacterized protein YndB with AHSA1/START domain